MNPVTYNGQTFNINKKMHSKIGQIHLIVIYIQTKNFLQKFVLSYRNSLANQRFTLPCVCVSCVFSSFLNVCVNVVAVWHLHRCYQMKSGFFSSFSSFLSLPSFPAGKNPEVMSLQMKGRLRRPL